MPGRIHYYADDKNHAVFKRLTPRTGHYIVMTSVGEVKSDYKIEFDILNLMDRDYPMNVWTSGDDISLTK